MNQRRFQALQYLLSTLGFWDKQAIVSRLESLCQSPHSNTVDIAKLCCDWLKDGQMVEISVVR
jgi:hypothetical protein